VGLRVCGPLGAIAVYEQHPVCPISLGRRWCRSSTEGRMAAMSCSRLARTSWFGVGGRALDMDPFMIALNRCHAGVRHLLCSDTTPLRWLRNIEHGSAISADPPNGPGSADPIVGTRPGRASEMTSCPTGPRGNQPTQECQHPAPVLRRAR
jgi:hypothetical protein